MTESNGGSLCYVSPLILAQENTTGRNKYPSKGKKDGKKLTYAHCGIFTCSCINEGYVLTNCTIKRASLQKNNFSIQLTAFILMGNHIFLL